MILGIHNFTCLLSEVDSLLSTPPSVSVATSCSGNRRKCFVSRARTCSEVNSSCSRCRWSRVEDEFETAAPAPRFPWLVAVVVQLQCDSCLEGSDAQNAQRVSPATPSKVLADREVSRLRTGRLPTESFFCPLKGCSMQIGLVFLFAGREFFDPNDTIGCSIIHSFSS